MHRDVFSAFVIKVGHLCFVTSQVLTLSLKQWGWYLSIVQSTRVAGFLFDSSGLSWTDTCHQYPGPKKLLKRLLWRRPSLCLHFHLTIHWKLYITTFLKLTCTILMSVKRPTRHTNSRLSISKQEARQKCNCHNEKVLECKSDNFRTQLHSRVSNNHTILHVCIKLHFIWLAKKDNLMFWTDDF